ncbi:MAG TPA: zf-HC2 domain-containing protein [Actinophytocola sp.]|nr:zf-HC2 domain-containing protein [Actinophytocola sp.]
MNPVDHDPSALAAYALGALDPAEQSAVQAHIAGCAECQQEVREFANLRAALDEVPPEAFLDGPPEGDLLLQKTLRRARAEVAAPAPELRRRRSPMGILAAAAVVAAVALGGGVVIGRQTAPDQVAAPPSPPSTSNPAPTPPPTNARTAEATDPNTGATMAMTVVSKMGWVTVDADVSGIPAGFECELRVIGKDGKSVIAGSWLVSKAGAAEGTPLQGAALIAPDDVASVDVVTTDGQTMVSVPV